MVWSVLTTLSGSPHGQMASHGWVRQSSPIWNQFSVDVCPSHNTKMMAGVCALSQ